MHLNFSPFQHRKQFRSPKRLPQTWQSSRYRATLIQPFTLPSYLHYRFGMILGRSADAQTLPPHLAQSWAGSRAGMMRYLSNHQPKLVCLDLDFEQSYIEHWADACQCSHRPLFLRVPPHPALAYRRLQGLWGVQGLQSVQGLPRSQSLAWLLKRSCDVLTAAGLLLLLSPLILAIAALVKLTSPGPVFFRQWRVGQRGQLFQIFKFRTMDLDAAARHRDVMGTQQGLNKHQQDPRITPLGHWLRKSSLDELPQLLNVLRGEMSLVGPRPWALYDAVQIRPQERSRLRALPGITGLWQVSGRSTLLDIDQVTLLDLKYLETWSLWNDFKILLMTLPSVLFAKGAC